jgi:peptidyl-prolyl cis-trans isomerase B (cyclophilin B)
MARTLAPHSASSQFFINVKNNSFLDYPGHDGWGYAVFGRIIDQESKAVVDAIRQVKTRRDGMFADVPVDDVVIESLVIEPSEAFLAWEAAEAEKAAAKAAQQAQ